MEYAVVVHKDGKVERVVAPFASKVIAQQWANDHVVKGNNWATAEFINPPPPAPPTPPKPVTE
jgi:hypothetical protein